MAILVLLAALILPNIMSTRTQANVAVVRQQTEELQRAVDQWLTSSPTMASARSAFTNGEGSSATSPASQQAFLTNNLQPYLDSATYTDLYNSSNSTQISSSVMSQNNAFVTLYWSTDYMNEHPKVLLTMP